MSNKKLSKSVNAGLSYVMALINNNLLLLS